MFSVRNLFKPDLTAVASMYLIDMYGYYPLILEQYMELCFGAGKYDVVR